MPPPTYIPFAPTVIFDVLTEKVTLYVDGGEPGHNGYGQFDVWF